MFILQPIFFNLVISSNIEIPWHYSSFVYKDDLHFSFTSLVELCLMKFRYDGQRAQIHRLVDGSIRVFSRNGDESTSRFPDLIDIIKESCKPVASTFIIDAEVKNAFYHNILHICSC